MVTKFKKNKKSQSPLVFLIFFILFLLLIIGFLAVTNLKISKKRAELASRIEKIKERIKSLEGKKIQLEGEISKAGSEEFIERKAREELGFKKPNEDMIVISKEKEEKETEEEQEKKNWWEKLKFWQR